MDLDTNAKKLNNNTVIKAICIVLSILMFGMSAGLIFNVARACVSFEQDLIFKEDTERNCNFTNSLQFEYQFDQSLQALSYKTNGANAVNIKKELDSRKQEVVENTITEFNKQRASFVEKYLKRGVITDEYYSDPSSYFQVNSVYTVPDKSIRNIVRVDNDAPLFIRNVQKIINGTKGNEFLNYVALVPENALLEQSFVFSQDIKTSEETYTFLIDGEINLDADYTSQDDFYSQYEEFVDEIVDYTDYDYDLSHADLTSKSSFKYYVINKVTNFVTTNLEGGQNKDDIIKSGLYYANVAGKVLNMGFEDFNTYNNNSSYFTNNYECYVTIDTTNNNDIYATIENFAKDTQNQDFMFQFIMAIVLFVFSVIVAIFVLINVGRAVVIDKIFIELHLVASFIVACLSFSAIAAIIIDTTETLIYSNFAIILVCLLATIGWAVICEYFCSVARIYKNYDKLRERFFVFRFIRKLYRISKRIVKKVTEQFIYKPKQVKRKTAKLIYLMLATDVFLLAFCIISRYEPSLQIIAFLGFTSLNSYVAYRMVKFAYSLDKIIVAATERTPLDVDENSLPESLAILTKSLKYTNDELREAVNKAIKDERLRTELITNVSHDLKTPLTSIITYVDLLSKCDINDENAKKYIGVLDEKGAKLKRLIDDLVEASKVSSGNVTLNLTKLDLGELAIQATGEIQDDFEKVGLELIAKSSENSPIICADGNKTFRVIENLLSNAKKYSAKSSRVYVSVYSEEEYGVFEIKNISAAPLNITAEELTERFVRGDESRTKEGNGLGLSIAKELCKAMGGKLELVIDGDLFKARVLLKK